MQPTVSQCLVLFLGTAVIIPNELAAKSIGYNVYSEEEEDYLTGISDLLYSIFYTDDSDDSEDSDSGESEETYLICRNCTVILDKVAAHTFPTERLVGPQFTASISVKTPESASGVHPEGGSIAGTTLASPVLSLTTPIVTKTSSATAAPTGTSLKTGEAKVTTIEGTTGASTAGTTLASPISSLSTPIVMKTSSATAAQTGMTSKTGEVKVTTIKGTTGLHPEGASTAGTTLTSPIPSSTTTIVTKTSSATAAPTGTTS